MNGHNSQERGAVLAIGAAAMFVILVVAALVIDLGSTRSQRASSQVMTDAAAAAGAMGLVEGGGPEACLSAVGYLDANLGAATGIDCSPFPVTCAASTPSVRATATVDDVTVTITHPVADTDPTMVPSGAGASAQPATEDDGSRCDRIAVTVERPTASFFRGVTGVADGATSIHSVARSADSDALDRIVNLLLVAPHECPVLTAGGNSSISVAPIIDPSTGDIYPGRIALDSDASAGCGPQGTIHTNGTGSITADGAPGCDDANPTSGDGCGEIETYAAGAPGCNMPACSEGGTISPAPGKSARPYTRAPFDWQFNCHSSYPLSYGIEPCPDDHPGTSGISDLIFAVYNYTPSSSSFQDYPGTNKDYSCSPKKDLTVPAGNWTVSCANLSVKKDLIFAGGNIVFEGDVSIGAQGHLEINTENPKPAHEYAWSPGNPLAYDEHSELAAWVYMKDGTLSKNGGGSFEFHNTMMYMSNSDNSGLDFSAGDGLMEWTAPEQGPFANLALWSDSDELHDFTGSANLVLEGIFFAPEAQVRFTGGSGTQSIGAQFVAKSVDINGGASLNLAPKFDRSITYPPDAVTGLIR